MVLHPLLGALPLGERLRAGLVGSRNKYTRRKGPKDRTLSPVFLCALVPSHAAIGVNRAQDQRWWRAAEKAGLFACCVKHSKVPHKLVTEVVRNGF